MLPWLENHEYIAPFGLVYGTEGESAEKGSKDISLDGKRGQKYEGCLC